MADDVRGDPAISYCRHDKILIYLDECAQHTSREEPPAQQVQFGDSFGLSDTFRHLTRDRSQIVLFPVGCTITANPAAPPTTLIGMLEAKSG